MGAKVLIVDDEPDVATYLATLLRAHGHAPTTARSVEDGFAQLEKTRPDVICLDIMMPRESGVSMYIRLKQNPETASIPVIVISGVEPEGRYDFRSLLANESVPLPERFFEKPVDVEKFVAAVERLVSDRPPASRREGR